MSPFLFQVSTYGATDAWDFVNDQYIRGGLLSDGGISITRNSVGTAETADGRIVTFGAGELRRTDKGLLVEGARTNLFLNSLVGETQSITVTAAAHTLSFYGTGTITLSGVSTDGPLVGTGAGQRVTLTFTPTAGSLTLTVSGTVEYVQLEVGAFASSWIPTEGASVQRAADEVTVNPYTFPAPFSAYVEYVPGGDATTVNEALSASVTTSSEQIRMGKRVGFGTNQEAAFLAQNTTDQAFLRHGAGTANVGATVRQAVRVGTNDFASCVGGGTVLTDTSGTVPTMDRIGFGKRLVNDTGYLFGYLRRAAIFNTALSNANLQAVTT